MPASRQPLSPLCDAQRLETCLCFPDPSTKGAGFTTCRLAKEKRERLRSAHLAPDYIPLGGAAGLANLESRLRPEGSIQPNEAAPGASDSDDDNPHHRMTFVGDQGNGTARSGVLSALAEEPQVRPSASRPFLTSCAWPGPRLPQPKPGSDDQDPAPQQHTAARVVPK